MFCPKCGAENKDNSKFCGKCGANFPQSINNSAPTNNSYKNPYNNPNGFSPYSPQKNSGNKTVVIIISVIGALFVLSVLLFFIGYYVYKDNKTIEKSEPYAAVENNNFDLYSKNDTDNSSSADENTSDSNIMPDNETPADEETQEKTSLFSPDILSGLSPSEKASDNKPNNESNYIIPYSDSVYLTEDDLKGLTPWQLKIARNEIYARKGRKFKDEQIQDYFNSQPWYIGIIDPDDFDESVFNDYENKNKNFIRNYETERGYN